MARLRRGRLRWVIAGGLVIALVAAAVVAWPSVQRYTGSAPPAQFYDKVQLEPALAQDYPRVLGVAHNAGNNLGTMSTALHYGADVIEIDVISARGQLVAGRDHWWGWLARQVFRGPTALRRLIWPSSGRVLGRNPRGVQDGLSLTPHKIGTAIGAVITPGKYGCAARDSNPEPAD